MENNDFNFKYNECIKAQDNIGETIYYNICNNETHTIKWGSDTWLWLICLFIFVVIILIMFITFLIKIIFDW